MNILMKEKSLLTLFALFTGGFVPIHLIVLSFGYSEYYMGETMGPKIIKVAHEFGLPYTLYLYIPSMIILVGIMIYSKFKYPDLSRRLIIGFAAGAIATIGLDWVRQMGVLNGWLPGDTPVMFGKMITGSSSFNEYFWIGQLSHFLNGAGFGLIFTIVFGNFNSYKKTMFFAILWLSILELGMMVAPPMAPMVGFFGVKWLWPELFLLTLFAHIVFGIILGFLVHLWLKREDSQCLLPFLKGTQIKDKI
ncbi:MAG: hypothetical protein COA66_10205 [Arcobacter sp.]|nr:MAG: hypothetical protein COA66_10205 [Arcobacter sp.]